VDPVRSTARRLERRAFGAVFLRELCRWSAGLLLVAGTLVLAGRAGLGLSSRALAPLFALAFLAPLVARLRAGQRRLSTAAATAWLDVRSGASGALVTGLEAPDPRWAARVEEALARVTELPRMRPGRALLLPLGAALFGALALLVRVPALEPGPSPALFQAAVQRAGEELTALKEDVRLDEDLARELDQRLERLSQELDGASPESTYEAIDRFEERLKDEARKAQDAAQRADDALASAAFAAGFDGGLSLERLQDALSAMKAGGLGARMPAGLQKELDALDASVAGAGAVDPGKMIELSDQLRELMQDRLAKLSAAGLAAPRRLLTAKELSELDGFEFAKHVCTAACKPGGL